MAVWRLHVSLTVGARWCDYFDGINKINNPLRRLCGGTMRRGNAAPPVVGVLLVWDCVAT